VVYFGGCYHRRYPAFHRSEIDRAVLNSTFASSAPSGALRAIETSLGSGQEASILVISMYLGGYILGPIVFAPVFCFLLNDLTQCTVLGEIWKTSSVSYYPRTLYAHTGGLCVGPEY
jgi:hypothetical protein